MIDAGMHFLKKTPFLINLQQNIDELMETHLAHTKSGARVLCVRVINPYAHIVSPQPE